ncbi:nuclear transport factor 2 family protein [Maricurvus nonylphenolicus]|uniref:nuclear transport factor 2 family protein n=1 Tax=Maricurvus nonylphenolicus TaxID=1008307 RepID=UPI0036F3A4C1
MSEELQAKRVQVLKDFAKAWNDHDINALMSFMTEDCIFDGSAGDEVCGTRFEGFEAVKAGYQKIWEVFPDAAWNEDKHFVNGDRGVSEWRFTGTMADGSKVNMHGNDLFVFRDDKIYIKDSYRKNRPPVKAD